MKSLLKILYFLLFLLVIFLLLGIFLPKASHVESSVTIRATPDLVFNQINTIKTWEIWSPWFDADSTMIPVYNQIKEGVGASFNWNSKHSGKGKFVITESRGPELIKGDLDFGINGKSTIIFKITEENEQSRLSWTLENKDLGYFERYFILLFRKNMLASMNEGLRGIRKIAQDLRLDRISEIEVVDILNTSAMCIKDSLPVDKVRSRMSELYPKLSDYLRLRKLTPTDSAFTIFYTPKTDDRVKFACCIPIPVRTWGWREYSYLELPQGKAAVITHYGKLETTKPFAALNKYFEENNLQKKPYYWEIVRVNPVVEPDTSKWEIKIFYPILETEISVSKTE